MNLRELLQKKRSAILERWFDLILATYPHDATQFLRKQKDPFANPVGHTISRGIEELYDELLGGGGSEKISPILDQIIRIRAVQDFSAAQAVGFVFRLKEAIRQELRGELGEPGIARDLLVLETRIDGMTLFAFDIYMKCREKMYEIKANEIRNRTFVLLKRAGLVSELQEPRERCSDGNKDS